MVYKKIWLGIPVMVLVFGLLLAGCDDGSSGGDGDLTKGKPDTALNGTWVSEDGDELKLNNGNYEETSPDGTPSAKGTYTTDGNKITMKLTHVYSYGYDDGFDSKWYSESEFRTAIRNSNPEWTMSDEEIDEHVDNLFSPKVNTYSVSGNKLTITYIITFNKVDYEVTVIYTKK